MAAAERAWEVHLRTQKMISRRRCTEPTPARLRSPEVGKTEVNSIIIKNYPSISEESDKEETEDDNNRTNDTNIDRAGAIEEEKAPSRHTSGNMNPSENYI